MVDNRKWLFLILRDPFGVKCTPRSSLIPFQVQQKNTHSNGPTLQAENVEASKGTDFHGNILSQRTINIPFKVN